MAHYAFRVQDIVEAVFRAEARGRGFQTSQSPGEDADSYRRRVAQIEEMKRWINDRFDSPENRIPKLVDRCMDKFIDSELDFATSGSRGLGRLVEVIPRFAAFHRNVVAKLDPQALLELGAFMKRHIACGYFFASSMYNLGNKLSEAQENIYENWIAHMYSQAFQLFPNEQAEGVSGLWMGAMQEDWGQQLKRIGIVLEETDKLISGAYFFAGITLRMIESIPRSEIQQWENVKLASFENLHRATSTDKRLPQGSGYTKRATGCLVAFLALAITAIAAVVATSTY